MEGSPKKHHVNNIVLLFDGTGNKPGKNKTNVVKTAELLVNSEVRNQILFYDPGVGTLDTTFAKRWRKIAMFLGKAFGYGLKKNIFEGYRFLMHHFKPGDRVYIFGFSRGAFTARKLADLLANYGLLRAENENLFANLLESYFSQEKPNAFWKKMCIKCKCNPHFIGVWDTVGSMGYFSGKGFFNNKLHSNIKYGYHAVAINERRKHFLPWLWEIDYVEKGQQINQLYFIGCHSDVGGWYDDEGLSDITLQWMLENAAKQANIKLIDNWETRIHANPSGKIHSSKNVWWMWLEVIDIRKWKKPDDRETDKIEKESLHRSVKERLHNKPIQVDLGMLNTFPGLLSGLIFYVVLFPFVGQVIYSMWRCSWQPLTVVNFLQFFCGHWVAPNNWCWCVLDKINLSIFFLIILFIVYSILMVIKRKKIKNHG